MENLRSSFAKIVFITIIVGLELVSASSNFVDLIPNGYQVPNPCNRDDIWIGVGHVNASGSGPLNIFGSDFIIAKHQWSTALCLFDSDGDGRTNGEELGDPDCQWMPGDDEPAVTDMDKLSHPAICEPLENPACQERNKFLLAYSECLWASNSTNWCPAINDSGVKRLTIRLNKTRVSKNETSHLCQEISLPSDDDYQIIAWEPFVWVVDAVYQLVAFACDDPAELAKLPRQNFYRNAVHCPMVPLGCRSYSLVWTRGAPSRCYDQGSGVPFGKNYYQKIILQVRYDNSRLKSNYFDSSGYVIYYKKLNDVSKNVGTIVIGQHDIAIPPQSPIRVFSSTGFSGNCSESKLMPTNNASSYKISSLILRTNHAGVYGKIHLRKRANNQLHVLLEKPLFFDKPPTVNFRGNDTQLLGADLEPGDTLLVECRFSTIERDTWTFYGEHTSSQNELCYAVFEVFPLPGGKMSQLSVDSGRYDSCTLARGHNTPGTIVNNCALADFKRDFVKNANLTDFRLQCSCRSPDYPLSACSLNCYNYVKSFNLSASSLACFKDTSLFTSLSLFEEHVESYYVHSQVAQCIQLKHAPPHSTSPSCSNSRKPAELYDYYDDDDSNGVKHGDYNERRVNGKNRASPSRYFLSKDIFSSLLLLTTTIIFAK